MLISSLESVLPKAWILPCNMYNRSDGQCSEMFSEYCKMQKPLEFAIQIQDPQRTALHKLKTDFKHQDLGPLTTARKLRATVRELPRCNAQ